MTLSKMARWRIEVIAPEPPSNPAPGLACLPIDLPLALSELGHKVRVLYPEGAQTPPVERGSVTAVPVPIDGGRRNATRISAFGRQLSARMDRTADLWLALDPAAGALPVTQGAGPLYAYVAESVAVDDPRRFGPTGARPGLRGRAELWWDRRVLRGLEEAALWRARLIFSTSPTTAERLSSLYRIPVDRFRTIPPALSPPPPSSGTKEAARLALHIPPDVPVTAFVGSDPATQGFPIVLDAFRKVRALFPGARLVAVRGPWPAEPGLVLVPPGGETTRALLLRAADVVMFPAAAPAAVPWDALGYGTPLVVSHTAARNSTIDTGAIRMVASDDPGDYASELAELLADPALRRTVGEAGKALADTLTIGRMAERIENALLAAPPAG